MLRFAVEYINDTGGVCLNLHQIISVYHDDTEIGVGHNPVGITTRLRPNFPRCHHHDDVAFEHVRQPHFFRYIIERDAVGVLALNLPAGKHQADRLEDEIHFCTARSRST